LISDIKRVTVYCLKIKRWNCHSFRSTLLFRLQWLKFRLWSIFLIFIDQHILLSFRNILRLCNLMLNHQIIHFSIIFGINIIFNHRTSIFVMINSCFLLLHFTALFSASVFQVGWWSLLLEKPSFFILLIQRSRWRLILHGCFGLRNLIFL